MLHANLQNHRNLGSGEKDFLGFCHIMGMAAILIMLPRKVLQNLCSSSQGGSI